MPCIEAFLATHPKISVITDVDGTPGLASAEALRYHDWMRRRGFVRGQGYRRLREKILQAEADAQASLRPPQEE
jgi:hypothetical protein